MFLRKGRKQSPVSRKTEREHEKWVKRMAVKAFEHLCVHMCCVCFGYVKG